MSILQTFKFIFSQPLSRNQRGTGYKRWLRWQIGSRIGLGGSCQAYGYDEQSIHRDILNLGFKQCPYNALTRELKMNVKTSWYTGNNLYVRNPKLGHRLVGSAKRYALIGMQI
jgi:hypothetical protein